MRETVANFTQLNPLEVYGLSVVATLFKVHYTTVHGWVKAGKLRTSRTPGGWHRVTGAEILRIAGPGVEVVPRESAADRDQRVQAGLERIRAAKR